MRKHMLLALAVLCSASLFATDLSIKDAFQSAKENSSSYVLALRQYQDSVKLTDSGSSLIPSLSLSANASTGYNFEDISLMSKKGSTGLSLGVSAGATFALSPAVYTSKETKNLTNQASYLSLLSAEQNLYVSVATAYINLALAKEAVAVSQSALDIAQASLDSVQSLYDAGKAQELTLMQAQNGLSSARIDLQSKTSSLTIAKKNFKTLTGIDIDESGYTLLDINSITLLSLPEYSELFEQYKFSNNAVQSARVTIQQAELGVTTLKNTSRIPTVSASVGYTYAGATDTDWKDYGTASNRLTGTVAVSVPLDSYIPGTSTNKSIKSAENSASYAQSALDIALESLDSSMDQLVSGIDTQSDSIALLQDSLDAIEYQLKLSEDAYNAGKLSLDDLNSVRNSVTSTKYSLLSAKANYILSACSLATMIGMDYSGLNNTFGGVSK